MKIPYAPGFAAFAGLTALVAAGVACADGPGAYRSTERSISAGTEQGAIDAYNAGFADIQRAERPDTTQEEARKAYKDALAKFELAVQRDRSMHEAYTYIGYANRKLGRYEQALAAYEMALRINPDYPHAIEYQGEAFLGLNRLHQAKFNYLRLYAIAPALADKLLRAMRHWIEQNSAKPPDGVDAEAFAAWVATRPSLPENTKQSGSW